MIKNGTLKVSSIGIGTITSLRFLSVKTLASGRSIDFEFNNKTSKPIILPPEPDPSVPFPSVQYPIQTPVIEIPGPIVEPSLPQPHHYPQPQSKPQSEPQPQPTSNPPIEIPVPNKNAAAGKSVHTSAEDDVLFKEVGDKGIITLNRPKALNALNVSMVEKIYPTLKRWESSKKVVIIEGTGEKAFCAGGDVKSIITAIKDANNKALGELFFRKEYTLNHLISTYKIPYVAIIHGITMGGGVGLSVHGKYRIATEKTLFAMPETAIGLFPDVGGSYFLPRLDGKLGLYLGLTGDRLQGVDVLLAGIATHFIPSDKLPDLKEHLLATEQSKIKEVLNEYQPKNVNQEFCLKPYMDKINKCFSAPSIEEIIERLKAENSDWANKTVQTLMNVSPSSLKITMHAIQKGSTLSLADCLKMEFRLACSALTATGDFYEGVRASLIDKDKKPAWKPKLLNDITDAYLNEKFAKLPEEKELQL